MAHPKAGYRKIALAAALFAVAGIALLAYFSETPAKVSIGQALASDENALVQMQGKARNITSDKFLLCERLCISVRKERLPSAQLLADGREATVLGRVKEYQGSRYVEAQSIDINWEFE